MKALVIGCGSIGVRHISHLLKIGVTDIEVADTSEDTLRNAQRLFNVKTFRDLSEALQRQPDIVLVCTPANLHIAGALQALDSGAHVFIEKPLSTSLDGVSALLEKARIKGRNVQVGYNLRYHPAIKAINRIVESGRLGKILTAHAEFGLYLGKWWHDRDYRQSYMARGDLGEGLLLDASHEIDSLMWFLGDVQQVSAFGGKLSELEISGADAIRILMRMKSGSIASVHLDCLQPAYTRIYTLVGEDTALHWDCPRGRADTNLGRLRIFNSETNRFESVRLRGRPEDTYVEELRDFVRNVKKGIPPLVGIQEGAKVLRVTSAIQEAIQTGQVVPV
jgi:predicted dehydrogenase